MSSITRLFALLVTLAIFAAPILGARQGEEQDPERDDSAGRPVVHLRIEGPLDVGTLGLLQRGIRHAKSEGNGVLVIEIDTPGGPVDLMIRFARQIKEAGSEGVLSAAWIRGDATSAGVLVSLACDRIFMSPTSTMGSATPVIPGPAGMQALPEEGGVREKMNSYVRAEFRAIAEASGRSPQLAEAMVDASIEVREAMVKGERRLMTGTEWRDALRYQEEHRDDPGYDPDQEPRFLRTVSEEGRLLNLTAREAVELKMADGEVASFSEVLIYLGQDPDAHVLTMERTRSEDLLNLLNAISPILLGVALLLGYTELKTQGFGIAGILSIACFTVVFAGRYFVGLADVPHLVLLFLGFALIALELFILPGQLWPGVLGGLLIFGSLIAMELGTDFSFTNAYDRSQALDASFRTALVASAAVIGALVLSHYLPDTPLLRRLVQKPTTVGVALGEGSLEAVGAHRQRAHVGAYGTAICDLRPVGKVVLDSDAELEYEARATGGAIDAGQRVCVVQIQGGRLVVEDAREVTA